MFKGRRKKRIFSGLAVVLVVVAAGAFWFSQQNRNDALADDGNEVAEATDEEEEDTEPAVPVEIATAVQRSLPAYFNATGSLEARRQVDLISKAAGQITRLNVEEGDYVKAGQILMEIDHRQEAILLEQANIRAATAQLELERMNNMSKQGLVTDREYEEKKQNAGVAEFERDLNKIMLEDKIVRAPYDGRITTRLIELGQTVNVGEALLGIADVQPLEITLYLPEKVVGDLRLGQPVEIRPDVGEEGRVLPGIVDRIAPFVDPVSCTVKVTLRLDEGVEDVRVGSFIRARITTDVHQGVVAIPKKAIVSEAGASFAFVADADSVIKVTVETGYADDDFIEVIDGVELGQRVVVVGQGGLRHGTRVRDLAEDRQEKAAEDGAEKTDADEDAQVAQAEAN